MDMPNRTSPQCVRTEVADLGDPTVLRGRLALLGWRSLSAWARSHGYCRNLTLHVVSAWGRPGQMKRRVPHGGITRAILSDLVATLAEQRRPADLQGDKP